MDGNTGTDVDPFKIHIFRCKDTHKLCCALVHSPLCVISEDSLDPGLEMLSEPPCMLISMTINWRVQKEVGFFFLY